MITIDGSQGEGGGQILRTALALSALTGKPFEITNIRATRPDPGLKPQHLHGVLAVQKLCNAKVEGAFLGSGELRFFPGQLEGGTVNQDTGTAGSITLLLQTTILPAAFAPKLTVLRLKGATDTLWSPPIDCIRNIEHPIISQFFKRLEINILKRGYYPVGGGDVEARIKALVPREKNESFDDVLLRVQATVKPFNLVDRGKVLQVKGVSHASKSLMEQQVAERQAAAAKQALRSLDCPVSIQQEYAVTDCPGSGAVLWAVCGKEDAETSVRIGVDSLGSKSVPSESIGISAAKKLIEELNTNGAVDSHLADMLIPWMGLLPGSKITVTKITEHTRTNIAITEKFLQVRFEIEGNRIKAIKR